MAKRTPSPIIMPGTTICYGGRKFLIGAVLWIGERYYMGIFSDGSVGLFPAMDVEACVHG